MPIVAKMISKSARSKSDGGTRKPVKTVKSHTKASSPVLTGEVTIEAIQKKAKELDLLLDGLTKTEYIIRGLFTSPDQRRKDRSHTEKSQRVELAARLPCKDEEHQSHSDR